MTCIIPSLNAHEYLQGEMTACSWRAGWRSLLVRAYRDPPSVEAFTVPATADQLIVLVTAGACDIEARYRGGWQRAHYEAGNIGMTAPGQDVVLRWRGNMAHDTIQLHLPAESIHGVLADLSHRDPCLVEMPNLLASVDPMIQQIMLGLEQALHEGVPDLYAETARELLAAHIVMRHAGFPAPRPVTREDPRLRRLDAFMRANLGASLSLRAMARQAALSRFHLLRLFKHTYGETPFKRLTRLRMEEAQRHLARGRESVTEIASLCGYENPAHFASAFRRMIGVSPTVYRRGAR